MKTPPVTSRIIVLMMLIISTQVSLIAKALPAKVKNVNFSSSLPLPVGDKMNINWSGWNNYPNTSIFYRIEVIPAGSTNATVAVEILNNYHKEISVSVALNDDGLKSVYQQIKNLKKNTSTVINYPRTKDVTQFFAFFNNLELN